MSDRSFAGLLEFLDWTAEKGLMAKTRWAVAKLLSGEGRSPEP